MTNFNRGYFDLKREKKQQDSAKDIITIFVMTLALSTMAWLIAISGGLN